MLSFKQYIKEVKEYPTYYHGSSDSVLDPHGFRLLPPNMTGKIQEKGRKKNLDRIFVTTDPKSAQIYAGRAVRRFGGKPLVVRAIPMGDVEPVNTRPGTSVYRAAGGFYEPINKGKT